MNLTPKAHFENRVLCPEIIAAIAISGHGVSQENQAWFIRQADSWIRYLHANNSAWHGALQRESNDDRDLIVMFVNHWVVAFLENPEIYKHRHPILPCI